MADPLLGVFLIFSARSVHRAGVEKSLRAGVGGEGVGAEVGDQVVPAGGCAQILKPTPNTLPSEWNANVVGPDTAIEAGNAMVDDDVLPQYFVLLPTWR
jgi:hypothetical protein